MDLKKLASFVWPVAFVVVATVVAAVALRSDSTVGIRPTAPLADRPEVAAEASESWLNPFSWGRSERTAFVVGQAHAEAVRSTAVAVEAAGSYSRHLFTAGIAIAVFVAAAAGVAAYKAALPAGETEPPLADQGGVGAQGGNAIRAGSRARSEQIPPGKTAGGTVGKGGEGKTARVGAGVEGG